MEFTETVLNNTRLLGPRGRLDSNTSPEFEKILIDRIDQEPRLILALKDLDYISSAGLRILLVAAKKVKRLQGRLVLCEAREAIREVLEISGFLSILDLRDTREAAAAAMGEISP